MLLRTPRYPAKLAAMFTVRARTAVLKKKATVACSVTSRRKARDLIDVSDVWDVAPMDVEIEEIPIVGLLASREDQA